MKNWIITILIVFAIVAIVIGIPIILMYFFDEETAKTIYFLLSLVVAVALLTFTIKSTLD